MIDNDNELLAHALTYARQAWRVLPLHTADDGRCSCGQADCGSRGKHPRIRQWQKAATTDESMIRRWWASWPDANIGVATGRGSGVFVIDVDGPTGRSTLERWRQEHEWQTGTLATITGRGSHLYFRQDGQEISNSIGKLGEGVDVRGDGGYVVAPPSLHATGHRYAWEAAGCPVADAPDWLLEAALTGKPVTCDAVAEEDVIQEGSRNDALFSAGCGLRGKGYEADEIMEELMKLNDKRCSPPLLESEVRDIAEGAAKYRPNAMGPSPASKESPLWWFPLDINEWCGNQEILFMTDYQVGWYIWLLVECWKTGGALPNDPAKLAKFARAKSASKFRKEMANVMGGFEPTPDEQYIVHTRMADEWKEKQRLVQTKKRAAKCSVAVRQHELEKAVA